MKLLNGLLERFLFTFGVLLFMQIPQFIDQYTQRLGGYYDAQRTHLAQYQAIADINYDGQLTTLIAQFQASDTPAIVQTGQQIESTRLTTETLLQDLRLLTADNYIPKLKLLVTRLDTTLAKNTLAIFKPGIPLTKEAIITGFIGGSLLNLLWIMLCGLLKKIAALLFIRSPRDTDNQELREQ